MTEIVQQPVKPVILVPKGCLGANAMRQLRRIGYCVIQANDVTQVKELNLKGFNAASAQAKIKAFEYAISGGPFNLTKNELRESYICFLKQQKAF